jgi:DNA-binding transcriptional regulator YhcF (GntR family)
MTEELMVVEVNAATKEETIRPMTAEEIAARNERIALFNAEEAERIAAEQAKADAKASAIAKLTALGLNEEEANALAGN